MEKATVAALRTNGRADAHSFPWPIQSVFSNMFFVFIGGRSEE
jgi:hypothetical protein